MKHLLILLIFVFSNMSSVVKAQDVIRTKHDTISAKVLEIGIDEIKYRNYSNLDGPIIVIPKNDVVEITYENGSKFFIAPDPYDVNKEVQVRNKKRSIKFEFFSPLTNDIAFGYETMMKVGQNLEIKVAVIGPGTAKNVNNASGFFFKGGVKFLTSPTYIQNGVKYSHGLKGGYIKPELIFSSYSDRYDYTNYTNYPPYYTNESINITHTNIGFDIVFGKQHLLGNIMTLDYYFGVGYALQYSSRNSIYPYLDGYNDTYSYSHLYLGKEFPMILTAGLTLGILL